nr:hypothetical protein [Tanacetum cinerariifolium]GFC12796.1 hypothetical protein [Tanacetum cinerariifolium]
AYDCPSIARWLAPVCSDSDEGYYIPPTQLPCLVETGANGISIKGAMTTEHANKANSENRLLSQVTKREILVAELSCHSRCQLRDRKTMRRDTDRLPSHT